MIAMILLGISIISFSLQAQGIRTRAINNWVMVFFCFLYPIFSEQSTLFSLYLYSWTTKNHEKILNNSTFQYLSLSTRISLIAILVMEIRKSQGDASVLFGIWSSFCCVQFQTKLTAELGKVLYKEVVEGFLPLPRVSLGCQNILIQVSSSKRRCKLYFGVPQFIFS